jgi:hypothetical protein
VPYDPAPALIAEYQTQLPDKRLLQAKLPRVLYFERAGQLLLIARCILALWSSAPCAGYELANLLRGDPIAEEPLGNLGSQAQRSARRVEFPK